MKKFYLAACFMFLGAVILSVKSFAGTAYPYPMKINQTDGTMLTVILHGDEYFSWAKTIDGYTLMYNEEGIYEYAMLNSSGNLVPSGQKARDVSERTVPETAFLTAIQQNLFFSSSQMSSIQQFADMQRSMKSAKAFPTTGNAKLLCILIGFSDLAFTETQANFNNLFNQVGYGTYGSVKDYYEECSYNQFHLTVDVAGPYTASNTHQYYGQNNPSHPYNKDINAHELVEEAVDFADPDVDFSDYDNDSDGKVDGIYIVYAGYNEAENGGADCIWYHASSISTVTHDGVDISRYSCSAEYKGNSGSDISGIGNICHEFGHVMGAPDFYDTDYGTGGQYEGTGLWDVMAMGNFNGDRDCPAHYNPYTKAIKFGWSTITTLSTQHERTVLNSTTNNNQFYRYNTTTTDEYFIFENKQQLGFDAENPGHGLIVYHVHKDIATGGINKTHPQKYYPVCADAGTEPSATPADYGNINSMDTPFPGGGGVTEFTDATVPSSKSWAGNETKQDLAFITENTGDNTITLCFMGCLPVADFDADEYSPCKGNPVDFTDLSEYATSWHWTFTPSTISYFGGSTSGSQNPRVIFNEGGSYTVELEASNAYGTDTETKTAFIYVHTPPDVTLHPTNETAEWGDDVTFTVAADGDPTPTVQWRRSTDGGSTFTDLAGETSTTLNLSCVTLDMSGYQYMAIFTNKCGDDWTDPAVLTVEPKTVTGTVTVSPNPQQYSDLVDITVEITDGNTCGEYAATGADIYIGSQYMGTVIFTESGSDLTATLSNVYLLEPTPYGTAPTGQMAPGPHTVTAFLLNVNPNFSITDPTTTLTILQEDVRAYYTGALYASTLGVHTTEAIITLSATIKDITAVDPGSDPNAGDIRNATLSFVNRDGGAVIASGVPIGLVDPADPLVAVGTYDWTVNITGDAEIFQIGIVVDGYYTRNSTEDDVFVSVFKPLPNFVTGGGYITLIYPAGTVAGDVGSKNHFAFNVKFNQNGTNLRGKVQTIIRRTESDGLHSYRIKGNRINSLAVLPNMLGGEATINCKASIEDITDPDNPVSVEGNASLQINMTDNGEPGANDSIGITVWDKWGGLWYASNWNGTITHQQLLDGGNLSVHSDNSFKSFAVVDDPVEIGDLLRLAPNPNKGEFTLKLGQVPDPGSRVIIIDMRGQIIDEFLLNTNEHKVDLKGSADGIYQIIVFNGAEVYRAKVVIDD